jgi:hypothetical protein
MSVPKFKDQILCSYTIIFAKMFTKFWYYFLFYICAKNIFGFVPFTDLVTQCIGEEELLYMVMLRNTFTEKLGQIITIAEAATWEESQYKVYCIE